MKIPLNFSKRISRVGIEWKIAAVAVIGALAVGSIAAATGIILIGKQADGTIVIPTNQILHPAGRTTLLGQRPVDMTLRPDGKQIAVMTTNLTFLIDPKTGKVTDSFDSGDRSVAGIAYSPDGTHLYYSKGTSHLIVVDAIGSDGTAKAESNIDTGKDSWPAGLSISPDGKNLYVALFGKNALGIVDLASKTVTKTILVGSSPFGAYVSPDGKRVYTSNWGGPQPTSGDAVDPLFPVKINPVTGATAQGMLSVYDVASGAAQPDIVVGLHPTVMIFDKDSTRLYVANSNEDTISVIDLTPGHKTNPELERIPVRPANGLPFGSMPNGLALNADGRTLYVANGGNNAIAVINLAAASRPPDAPPSANAGTTSELYGFIPTEWFPIGVALSPDNSQLYIANNKGEGSLNNVAGFDAKSVFNLTGSVSIVSVPDATELSKYTAQVDANNTYTASLADVLQKPRPDATPVPVPARVGEPSIFKHVIYVLKENRTYDQVLGDMGKGNSDPKLAQFPRNVSPNHHALADRFGLLDNYYACSVNSADGHQWTDEAIGNVFAERVYGNYPSSSPSPMTAYGNSSLDLPPDSLWSNALAHNITLRNYGESGINTVQQKQPDGSYKTITKLDWSDIFANWKAKGDKYKITSNAVTPPLMKSQDPTYPAYDNAITDQIRADEWEREFNAYVKNNNLPQLSVIWLPDDHTSGTRSGTPTPSAQVADNDLALGRIVDALSHSAYWKDTVVFVTEDDAQNGTDHVDGHRTVGLVISAYNKPNQVNSTLYNQTSMVRTIEQILGIPPMNQFDLTATLMANMFTTTPDLTPYSVVPNQIPLDQLNGQPDKVTGFALNDMLVSNGMNFSVSDANDPAVLNQIIWHSTMGNIPYPTFEWQQRTTTGPQIAVDDGDLANSLVQGGIDDQK